jgi:ribonuclease HI
VAIKALNNFQIYSKFVWDCLQSMVKLADHNRMQLVWMPGHMGIDGNTTADQAAGKASHIHSGKASHIHSYKLSLPVELL